MRRSPTTSRSSSARRRGGAATRSRSPARCFSAGSRRASARSAPRCASAPTGSPSASQELEALPPAERASAAARAAARSSRSTPNRRPTTRPRRSEEAAIEGVIVAETLDGMRVEVARARSARRRRPTRRSQAAEEAKLDALRDCLQHAELAELRDGRGKLLIFTEHRDTLDYLERNLASWGYTTCSIHGGLPPVERKQHPAALSPGAADLRRDRGGRRGDQPAVLPPDDQLRPAVEPGAARAADGPHPPHRPGATSA